MRNLALVARSYIMYPYVSMHDVSKCVQEELRTSGILLGYRMMCIRLKLKHRIVINILKQTGGGMGPGGYSPSNS